MTEHTETEPLMHWSDPRPGNTFLRKFDPRMLLPDGFVIRQEIQPVGTPQGTRVWVQVKYDRDYVVQKLCREVLQPLNIKQYNTFQKLVSEAWEECKKT